MNEFEKYASLDRGINPFKEAIDYCDKLTYD